MTREDVLRRYLEAIQARDLAALLALFSPHATVSHPVFGDRTAAEFFPQLLEATASDTPTRPVLLHADGPTSALFFLDDWSTPDGARFRSPIVLVFGFGADGLVDRLTVVFDTAPLANRPASL